MTVLAFDIGTSGVKAVLVDSAGRIQGSAQAAYPLITRPDGWVEQDLDAIEAGMADACQALVGAHPDAARAIDGIGITAQMFDLAPVDADGRSTIPMLSWLDQRAVAQAESLASAVAPPDQARLFHSVVTAKDVIPKILWLRDARPDAWASTRWLLDCKEAMVLRLTGHAVIDPGGALAFRLYDPAAGSWSREACQRIDIPVDRLPDVAPATAIAGGLLADVADRFGLRSGIPVVVGAGDVPASQVGAGATDPGDAHVSLGTAVYFGITTDRPVEDPRGVLGVIGHVDPARWILWLEVATGGGALAWLLRALDRGAVPSKETLAAMDGEVAAVADEMDDLLFAPWLSGERVPVFDDRIRGAFVGLGLNHRRAHLIRALMEGVAYQMRWALDYGTAYGVPIGMVRGVGGGFIGETWTQIIADVMDRPIECIERPQDAGAVGAAACALVGIGAQDDIRFVRDIVQVAHTFRPDASRARRYVQGFERYRRLYGALEDVFRPAVSGPIPSAPGGPGRSAEAVAPAQVVGASS